MTLKSVEEVQRTESQDTGSPDGDTVGDILPALPAANSKGRRGEVPGDSEEFLGDFLVFVIQISET